MNSIKPPNWHQDRRDGLGLPEILNVLWGRRVLVAGVIVALALVAVAYGLIRDPAYSAEAVVYIESREGFSEGEDAGAFIEEVVGAVANDEMLMKTARRAGYEGDLSSFRDRLDVRSTDPADGEPGSLRVAFPSSDPEEAARTANAYAGLFVERVEDLNDRRIAGGALDAEASVRSEAVPPSGGSWFRIALYALGAIAGGVLAGGAAALALDGRVRSWRGPRDAELTLRVPVIGVIPEYETAVRSTS